MESLISDASEELGFSEDHLRERWSRSPEKIAEDLFRVQDVDTGDYKPLELFSPYQPQILHAYFFGDEEIINVYKGRRIGVSFVFCLATVIDGLRHSGTFYPIVADTQSQANNRIEDIRNLIEHAKIDIPLEKDNQSEIVLENGTRYEAFSGAPDSSRGDEPAKTVFIDEMAFLEDQDAVMRAFMPFISLGSQGKVVQVSTPSQPNDRFLNTHEKGSPEGENGIISLKQPTFKNSKEIDPTVSLFEQDAEPVRPDLNVKAVETERLQDPKGFAQEYLCQPIADEYRFFDPQTIEEAQEKGKEETYAARGWNPSSNSTVVMGVDIGISEDDTVASVWEHDGSLRNLRYLEIITDRVLAREGIKPAARRNPSSVAKRISQIHDRYDVDYVVMDKTGPGQGFRSEIDSRIGRGAHGFAFDDKEAVEEMMGDFNYGLHRGLITLLPEDAHNGSQNRIKDELEAIVKKQSHEYQKPKFTGKEYSETGKDDVAMSLVLGAYPPNIDTGASKEAQSPDDSRPSRPTREDTQEGASHFTGAVRKNVGENTVSISYESTHGKRLYKRKHDRT